MIKVRTFVSLTTQYVYLVKKTAKSKLENDGKIFHIFNVHFAVSQNEMFSIACSIPVSVD